MYNPLLLVSLLLASELRAQYDNDDGGAIEGSGKVFNRLRNENYKLEQKKAHLREKCQKDIDYWAKLYNETYSKLKREVPQVVDLEKQLSEAVAKEAGLDRALEEMKIMFELLHLKRNTLSDTVEFLKKHESEAQQCFDYGHYIGFERQNTDNSLSVRSGRTPSRLMKARTFITRAPKGKNLEKERQNILMEIMLQQERFKNVELKEYIAYFTGYCSRKLELLKQLVESLKKWPEALEIQDEVRDEISKVNKSIATKSSDLQNQRDKLQALIAELTKAQAAYDERSDAANCLKKLGDWPIKDALKALTENMQTLSNFQSYIIPDDHHHLVLEGIINKYSDAKIISTEKEDVEGPSTFQKVRSPQNLEKGGTLSKTSVASI